MLAATDPAQPYGAALPWPKRDTETKRPARQPGAHVVLVGDEPVLYLERGGKGIQVLLPDDEARVDRAIEALVEHVRHGRAGRLGLERVDGEPVVGSPWEERLIEAGFRPGPRKLALSA